MTLKLAGAGADFVGAVAGWALVTLAQPAASVTSTVTAASVVASRRDAVMTMRRILGPRGSAGKCAANPRLGTRTRYPAACAARQRFKSMPEFPAPARKREKDLSPSS